MIDKLIKVFLSFVLIAGLFGVLAALINGPAPGFARVQASPGASPGSALKLSIMIFCNDDQVAY